uniref:Unannotated protein n=1 Tax=freshwater metagenome TaxID=449393 RepID=A0A6J5ZCZ3_9ZZZZ
MGRRIETLATLIAEQSLDWLIVSEPSNLRWLTDFTGSNAVALCPADPGRSPALLLTDFRYTEQVEAQAPSAWQIEISKHDLLGAGLAEKFPVPDGGGESYGRVGFDSGHVTVAQLEALDKALDGRADLVPVGGILEQLRAVKSAGEVEKIRAAALLADEAMLEVLDQGLVGRTEIELALALELAIRSRGAQELSFPPIVAAGAHGALPHAEPRDIAVEAGELVTFDWGARLDGYCSDCTRTWATGPVGDLETEVYDTVLRAQEEAVEALRPGPSGAEIDRVARGVIEQAGFGENFGHGLGHGVGLDIHEAPKLSRTGDQPLLEGMVVTVEPGIYLPGKCGVRIEDVLVLTADGSEPLNGLDKQFRQVS